jgi:hypothetical protein
VSSPVNDVIDVGNLAYLLKDDTVCGRTSAEDLKRPIRLARRV